MPGLMDAAPRFKDVDIGGTSVRVFGLSAMGIAQLMQRFPEVKAMLAGREVKLTAERMVTLVPEAAAAAIAAGCGEPGDEKHEAHAATLALDDQMTLLLAIMECTAPGGPDPLFDKADRLADGLGLPGVESAATGKAPATKSSRPSRPS